MRGRKVGFMLFVLAGIAVLIPSAGCGPGNPQNRKAISGKVSVDGAPLPNGAITFEPIDGGSVGSGALITTGAYSMAEVDGLPPGKYRVTMTGNDGTQFESSAGSMPGDEEMPPTKELVPDGWSDEIEVAESGPFEFNFEITSTKKK